MIPFIFRRPIATDNVTAAVRGPSVCVSLTLVHPAKAAGRNEVPFGRDTRVVPSNIIFDRVLGPPREGEIWESEPPVRSDAAYRQITLACSNINTPSQLQQILTNFRDSFTCTISGKYAIN